MKTNLLKLFLLLVLVAALLLTLVPTQYATADPLNYPQDPATFQWADVQAAGSATANQIVTIDLSTALSEAGFVHGYLSLLDTGNGRGAWQIEARPGGILGGLGFMPLPAPLNTDEISFQIFMRLNAGVFQIRVNRTDLTTYEWAFSPVAWE